MLLNFFLLSILISIKYLLIECFIPAQVMNFIIKNADDNFKDQFGEVSETFVHEEIIRRGVIRSVAKYFSSQNRKGSRINLDKIEQYYDLNKLYFDFYGTKFCKIGFEEILYADLQKYVASVDFDPETKDMPYAHFDAEKFIESNDRVMNFTNRIYNAISKKNYERARELTGQVLHTIHDFYSHSNWIEMGNHNKINTAIGTPDFNNQTIAGKSDNITCIGNCTIKTIKCGKIMNSVIDLLQNLRNVSIDCPIKFFTCSGNIAVNNKLISGYYTGQTLPDGTSISKPKNSMKCSHGGLLDNDSFKPATGGINKDSGYYLFSPHANLHLIAANLAINHAEYFFDQIRAKIGDKEFGRFLRLKLHHSTLNKINKIIQICTNGNDLSLINKIKSFISWFRDSNDN